MDRRSFLRLTAGSASALRAGNNLLSGASARRAPNIVMIISDDQGWGDYGFMRHPVIRTPRLDGLARESAVFTRGYVTAPLCCPSLASLITGLHPHQHKITSNDPPNVGGSPGSAYEPRRWSPERLALRNQMIDHIDKAPTLPRLLSEKGYASFQAGKWWLGHHSRGGFTAGMTHGDTIAGGRHGDEGLRIGRETMQPVFDFINRQAGNPFFLWFAPMLPHAPHNPPERLLAYYRDRTSSLHVARYWAMCEWWDEVCGQLLDHLALRGLADDTLVVYLADNGWIQSPDSPRFAPRSKRSPYDGGVRTPVMVRFPGRVKGHRDDRRLVSSIDLVPTILAAAGVRRTSDMQGISLTATKPLESREAVFGAAYSHDAVDIQRPVENLEHLWAVEDEWKLILPVNSAQEGKGPELFRIRRDPGETTNLAAEHAGDVARLTRRIQRWWPEGASAAGL